MWRANWGVLFEMLQAKVLGFIAIDFAEFERAHVWFRF